MKRRSAVGVDAQREQTLGATSVDVSFESLLTLVVVTI